MYSIKRSISLLFIAVMAFCLTLSPAAVYAEEGPAPVDAGWTPPMIKCELTDGESRTVTIPTMTASDEGQIGITAGKAGWYHLLVKTKIVMETYRYSVHSRSDFITLAETIECNASDHSAVDIYINMEKDGSYVFGLMFWGEETPESIKVTASFDYVGSGSKVPHTHSYGTDGFCKICDAFIFEDVNGKKSQQYVSWAYSSGIAAGTGSNAFSPKNACTRAQFVMMLWKMNGSPDVSGVNNPFKDVTGSKLKKAVLWALDKGIIKSGKAFQPEDPVSRINIVMMLWKMSGSPGAGGECPFTDVNGSKTVRAVMWAYNNGITAGTGETKFSPDKNCTRLQLVTFLYKYYN